MSIIKQMWRQMLHQLVSTLKHQLIYRDQTSYVGLNKYFSHIHQVHKFDLQVLPRLLKEYLYLNYQ